MNDVSDALLSPIWWFSVVGAGILVNLLSAYVKPRIDSYFSSLSSWWMRRSALQTKERNDRVIRLAVDRYEQIIQSLAALRLLLWAALSLLCGIFVILFGQGLVEGVLGESLSEVAEIIRNAVAAACLFISFLTVRASVKLRRVIEEARLYGNGRNTKNIQQSEAWAPNQDPQADA